MLNNEYNLVWFSTHFFKVRWRPIETMLNMTTILVPHIKSRWWGTSVASAGPSSASMRATKPPSQTSTSGKTAVLAQVLNNSMYQKNYAIVARKMSQKLVGNWCIVHKIALNVKLDWSISSIEIFGNYSFAYCS